MPRPNLKNLKLDIDYYRVLGVAAAATQEEIRRSYRRLALQAHPDKNPGRREWAEARIRELIEAYEVLSDETTRRLFDQYRRGSSRPSREQPFFFYKKTPGARALLILHYLVNGREGEAAEILEEMEEEFGRHYLREYLDREDYLDSLFLLAEHFIRNKLYLAAAERLRTFYHHDCQSRRPRHYMDEVVRLLKDLYLRKLPKVLDPGLQVSYLLEAAEFSLSPKEELLRLRLLVENAVRCGKLPSARAALDRLRQLDGEAKDVERLEELFAACRDGTSRRMRSATARTGHAPRRRRARE